jgi:hypothetical protein
VIAVIDAHNRSRHEHRNSRNKPAKNEVFHSGKLLPFPARLSRGEKALANRPMRVKRIEDINTSQSVPKKSKIVQSKNQAPPEAGESASQVKPGKAPPSRRATTSRKKLGPREKKIATVPATKVPMPPEAGGLGEPSDEQIRLRAYFISERRRRFALPGDAESDWLEARRQLLSELRTH